MSKNNGEDTEQIVLMLKELEGIRERTEQVANLVDSLRFYTRVIRENAQSALITGDMDDLLGNQPLPGIIEYNAETLGRLTIGIKNDADLLDMHFYYISGEGEDKEDEE